MPNFTPATASTSEMTWKRNRINYPMTFAAGAAQFIACAYLIALHIGNPPPKSTDLNKILIRIEYVQERNPHLLVKLQDERTHTLEFPTTISLQSKRYYGISPAAQKQLRGCTGHALITPVNLTPTDRTRVWALNCGGVDLTLDQSLKDFKRHSAASRMFFIVYCFLALSFTGFIYWTEKRESKRRNK